MKKIVSTLFLFFMMSTALLSQTRSERKLLDEIDKVIGERYKDIAPGCAVLVAKKGKPIYQKAFGISNVELNVAMSTGSVFRIGSITKEFTAVAILQLEEKGKLSLRDSLQKFIPYFPYKGQTITIENLLTHTSGIMDFQELDAGIPDAVRIGLSPKRIIDSLKDRPLQFTPGEKYSYSNTNYFLLGMIIEKISGQSYKKYMLENIFKPFDLTNTRYDDPVTIVPQRASGYRKQDGRFVNADYLSMNWPYAAGALQSTIGDLYKWHEALYHYRIIRKETLTKATTNFLLSNGEPTQYGYGFFIRDWKGNKTIGHGGAIEGFRAIEWYLPGQDIYLAMLFNAEEDTFLAVFEDVAAIIAGTASSTTYTDLAIDNSILDSYTGTYAFDGDSSLRLSIYRIGNRLFADLSDRSGTKMAMLAQTQNLFLLPDVWRILTTIEFFGEKDRITGLYWTQKEKHRAKKIDESK
jgi:CubicO group peptidase (beta-lactamase class C family)